MAFKLPKLETDVDCEPIGYPGLTVTFWLNIQPDDYEPPEDGQPWDTLFYHGLARLVQRVTFPPTFTTSGEVEVLEIDSAEAMYDLLMDESFEQAIIVWAQGQYQEQRQERMAASVKN